MGDEGHRLLAAALDTADEPSDRTRLLAASARARAYEGDPGADQAMTDATDMVRDLDDPASLAFVLGAARTTKPGPDHLGDRVQSSAELVEVTRRSGDREALVEAQRLRLIDLLQRGEVAAAEDLRAELDELIAQLHRPLYLWYQPMGAAMRAILAGDGEADELVAAFAREGERWHYRNTAEVVLVQRLQLAVQDGAEPPRSRRSIATTPSTPPRGQPCRRTPASWWAITTRRGASSTTSGPTASPASPRTCPAPTS